MTQINGSREDGLRLVRTEEGLALTDGRLTFSSDLSVMVPRIKKGAIGSELLVKAARLKDMSGAPRLLDATAGLGYDALLLAAAGFDVTMCEYDTVIAELLSDSLRRASSDPGLAFAVSSMHLLKCDSIGYMRSLKCGEAPDVIYLDPMFPGNPKNSLIKKKFQLIRQLELPCSNEDELLEAAIAAGPHKIVIKRPLKGPYLAGKKPAYSIKGKAIRYDCLIFA